MKFEKNESILILGGSRGLGLSFLKGFKALEIPVENRSRKSLPSFDFSKTEIWPLIIEQIVELNPSRIIYCAGGGPYGPYSRFEWKDHQWSLRVNFEFPAFLILNLLKKSPQNLKQLVFIGSQVAESKPDPGAASYAAGKHALKGLIFSIIAENQSPFDLRLLSPGYMDTDLLPLGAPPRLKGLARSPDAIASQMIQSISNPEHRFSHQCFD
ncbi:MAG: SDR family NAD(P)-dependent oxidoreductase [Bdellovibrionales bacterium]